jgi:carbon storage regulator
VLIGDSISVTVVSIRPEIATLFVRYRDQTQRVEQKLSLEVDDRLEITSDIHVYMVDIRSDKVRLGVVAPATFTVHRKEVFEALQRQCREVHCYDALTLAVGQTLAVGDHLRLSLADVSGGREIRSRGQFVGGPRDGESLERRDPISVGSVIEFGTLVRVCILENKSRTVGLKIEHPVHMICRFTE